MCFPVSSSTRFNDSFDELQRLSYTTTSYPSFKSSSAVWLPMYPAPPVINIFFAIIVPPIFYLSKV